MGWGGEEVAGGIFILEEANNANNASILAYLFKVLI